MKEHSSGIDIRQGKGSDFNTLCYISDTCKN